jgi:hypothetical protein
METLLQSSNATNDFKADIARFLSGDRPERVKVETYAPRVKVRRLLSQLLSEEPALEIEQVEIRGMSGCSDFVGSVNVHTTSGTHVFDFAWCCRWRAEREGYLDYFGFPDQMRAAQEFDWKCFRQWERRSDN